MTIVDELWEKYEGCPYILIRGVSSTDQAKFAIEKFNEVGAKHWCDLDAQNCFLSVFQSSGYNTTIIVTQSLEDDVPVFGFITPYQSPLDGQFYKNNKIDSCKIREATYFEIFVKPFITSFGKGFGTLSKDLINDIKDIFHK